MILELVFFGKGMRNEIRSQARSYLNKVTAHE